MSIQLTTRLAEEEAVIERGLTTFVEVGTALMKIRDARLYRDTHETFEDYCRERWGWSRQRSLQLIDGAEVARLLTTTVVIPERQARELVPLMREAPELVADAFEAAVEQSNGHPTAAVIREVVDGLLEREAPIAEPKHWMALKSVLDSMERFAATDAASVIAAIPDRRRAATARKLRKLGTYLARIAWTLEKGQ